MELNKVSKPCRQNLILFDFSGHVLLSLVQVSSTLIFFNPKDFGQCSCMCRKKKGLPDIELSIFFFIIILSSFVHVHQYDTLLGSKLIMQTFLYHYFRIVTHVAPLVNNEVSFDIF